MYPKMKYDEEKNPKTHPEKHYKHCLTGNLVFLGRVHVFRQLSWCGFEEYSGPFFVDMDTLKIS